MLITVQFFAHLGDIAGAREREICDNSIITVADIQSLLSSEDSRFAESFRHCRIAVNSDWATTETVLAEGDEVSFIPPVSGG